MIGTYTPDGGNGDGGNLKAAVLFYQVPNMKGEARGDAAFAQDPTRKNRSAAGYTASARQTARLPLVRTPWPHTNLKRPPSDLPMPGPREDKDTAHRSKDGRQLGGTGRPHPSKGPRGDRQGAVHRRHRTFLHLPSRPTHLETSTVLFCFVLFRFCFVIFCIAE